jgi:hypothetical protein
MQLPKISILITLMICLFGVNPAMAEPGDRPTPTTRILAIGTVNPGVDISKVQAILPEEMRETARQDRPVVFPTEPPRSRFHLERHRHRCRSRYA